VHRQTQETSDNMHFSIWIMKRHHEVSNKIDCTQNKGHSNLVKGDITRLIRNLVDMSISSIVFDRWQHASRSWSWGAFGTSFLRNGGCMGQRWYHPKEQWWFPMGSPLWPMRYLLIIRPQFANAQINRGWVSMGQNLWRGWTDVSQI